MRYENPLYMAEEAAATDLISENADGVGRLQLGISRGSPEPALRGAEAFGYQLDDGVAGAAPGAAVAREKTDLFRAAIAGAGVADPDPDGRERSAACRSASVGRARRSDLVGLRHPRDREVDRRAGDESHELDPPG